MAQIESTITGASRSHAKADRVTEATVLEELADQLAALRQKTGRITNQVPGAAMDAVVSALASAQPMMPDRQG